jgi:hypothetical protein
MKQEEVVKWVIVIAIIYLIYKVIKGFSNAVTTVTGSSPGLQETTESELEQLINIGINPTISPSTASQYADFIEDTSLSLNTDEEGIFNVFRALNNKADLLLLQIQFGKRRPNFSAYAVGLNAFLKQDLNNSEINTINEILRQKRLPQL